MRTLGKRSLIIQGGTKLKYEDPVLIEMDIAVGGLYCSAGATVTPDPGIPTYKAT